VRVVLDTNVVVSGLLTDLGAPAQIVELCLAGDLELVIDGRIVAKYREVLRRPELSLDAADVEAFLGIVDFAEHVVGVPLPLTLPDPDDLPFLEVAVAAAVDALVTGNARHFRAPEGKLDISVVSPRQFLDRFSGR
jgi:putative PIN family toxin of toxin-antitoxin system